MSASVYIIFQSKRVVYKNMSNNPYQNKITVGSVYKYKTLCNIMGESVKTSNSKAYQLKRWKGYFDWVNPTKQTYKIIEIYDCPVVVEDGRKNNGDHHRLLHDIFAHKEGGMRFSFSD